MQFVLKNKRPGLNYVWDADNETKNFNVLPEHKIQDMSTGTLRLYRNRARELWGQVQGHGTHQVVQAVYYVVKACDRAVEAKRQADQWPDASS